MPTTAGNRLQGQNNSSESSTTAGLQLHKKQLQHQGMPTTAETPEAQNWWKHQ
jgi:hypothetical protein